MLLLCLLPLIIFFGVISYLSYLAKVFVVGVFVFVIVGTLYVLFDN